ncbi:MAG: oligoendopeptidase F, partial [Anaerolineales bacterium]
MTFTQTKWSLADLYPGFNTPELESAFDVIEEQVTSFEGLRSNLISDMPADRFLDVVHASEEMNRVAHKLYAFASLSFAANTQDQAAQSLQSRVQQFLAEMENRTLFFDLWWKDLDDENAKRLMDASGDYQYYLEEMRHFKPHTLSEPEEKIINLKNVTGSQALITLYSSITSRYVFKIEVD